MNFYVKSTTPLRPSFIRRFLAFSADLFFNLLIFFFWLAFYIWIKLPTWTLPVKILLFGETRWEDVPWESMLALGLTAFLILYAFYHVTFMYFFHQTPGKAFWGIKLVSNFGRPTLKQILIREVLIKLLLGPFVLDFASLLYFRTNRQNKGKSISDYLSDTYLTVED